MKSLSVLLCLGVSLLPALSLSAQDNPQINTDAILRDLDLIEQQQKQLLTNSKATAINRIRSAAASGSAAVALYVEAFEATEFEGKPNKATLLSDWKNSSGDLLRSRELQTIVGLHLKYLALSLERAASENAAEFAAPSLAYVQELAAADPMFSDLSKRIDQIKNDKQASARDKQDRAVFEKNSNFLKELLQKPITDSIFTKWLRLNAWLPGKGAQWEMVPGNLSGILEKNVRGALRDQKSPQLIATWDFEMKFLADRATAGRLTHQAADFNTTVAPALVFSRANDYVVLGAKNRAIVDIYNLVKTQPQHADFKKWVARLRELLPSQAAAPAEPAPEASVAPGTSPQ